MNGKFGTILIGIGFIVLLLIIIALAVFVNGWLALLLLLWGGLLIWVGMKIL